MKLVLLFLYICVLKIISLFSMFRQKLYMLVMCLLYYGEGKRKSLNPVFELK